jgi:hypothetical protein
MSNPNDDDLPRRWAAARPRCWRCSRTVAACVCLGVMGLLIVQQDEPDELTGHAGAGVTMAFAPSATSGATTSTVVFGSLGFPAHAVVYNEVTGAEIATQPPMLGRAMTARQNVVQLTNPNVGSGTRISGVTLRFDFPVQVTKETT